VSNVRRFGVALLAVLGVVVAGSIGYVVLGYGLLDAVYQTVTTITTVGFREVHPLGTSPVPLLPPIPFGGCSCD
jgi:voltage-gated potassium channel